MLDDTEFITPEDVAEAQIAAMRQLGRFEGATAAIDPALEHLVALALSRLAVIEALRGEGHEFTMERFDAWFAGTTTLQQATRASTRSARAICRAVLTELQHNSWEALAMQAGRLEAIFLGPGELDEEASAEACNACIAAANELVDEVVSLENLAEIKLFRLFEAVAGRARASEQFSEPERKLDVVQIAGRSVTIEATQDRVPLWAIDLVVGRVFQSADFGKWPLPCPGLMTRRLSRPGLPGLTAQHDLASSLHLVLERILRSIDQARRALELEREVATMVTSASRLPSVISLLAVLGGLRSQQLEILLGASRLGVRNMLNTGRELGLIGVTTIAGVRIYGLIERAACGQVTITSRAPDKFEFSNDTLNELDASMAALDRLNARYGVIDSKIDED